MHTGACLQPSRRIHRKHAGGTLPPPPGKPKKPPALAGQSWEGPGTQQALLRERSITRHMKRTVIFCAFSTLDHVGGTCYPFEPEYHSLGWGPGTCILNTAPGLPQASTILALLFSKHILQPYCPQRVCAREACLKDLPGVER